MQNALYCCIEKEVSYRIVVGDVYLYNGWLSKRKTLSIAYACISMQAIRVRFLSK